MNRLCFKIILAAALLVFLIYLPLFAAEQNITFEQKHSDRDAIFLLDDLKLVLNEDWSYTTHLHKRIKILKEEAKSLGEIPLYYENGRDNIKVIFAFTITPDGKKHRYSKIQDFKTYSDFPMYSDAMVKVITMPEVNIGSVIEFEVEITSMKMNIKDAFWDSFSFDCARPTQEINTIVTLPEKFNIAYKEFSLKFKPRITTTPKTITYSWNLKNMDPAEKSEEYLPIPTPESFTNTVEFSSIKNWEEVSKWYYALVEKNLKLTKEIEDAARGACKDKTALKDKARAILEYIQDNFRYVSMSFGENSLEPHPTNKVFLNKYGDCKDLSLICLAMLKAVGINSYVALFNNESSISDPKYDLPSPSPFNHAILLVEDKINGNFYIDPLLNGYAIDEFPLAYQGAYTFIINGQGGRLDRFPIFDEKRNSTKTVRSIVPYEDGSALFEVEHTWELGSSIEMRDRMKAMDTESKQKFYDTLDAYLITGGEMISRRVEGLDKKYGLIKGCAKYKKKDAFPLDGNMMIIDVAGYARDLDFTQKERKNPIFCPVNSLVEETTAYKIPKGFSISYLPNNISLSMGFFGMKREYRRVGNTIIIVETTRLKRSQYPKEDYTRFKDFFDRLTGKTQQRIILKKNKPWAQKISEISAIIKQ